MKKVKLPLDDSVIKQLKAGDRILLEGIVYTARDAAHKKMQKKNQNRFSKGRQLKTQDLPFNIKGQVIYYTGPTPAPPGKVIGSCGPTTSARMDVYTPALLKSGLKGMIGKGDRSQEVRRAIKKYGAVYFVAIGGTGALLSKKVKSAKIIAYKDLGPEAIYKLEIKDFPVVVGIDSRGNSIYKKY